MIAIITIVFLFFGAWILDRGNKDRWKGVERPTISWTRCIVTICILLMVSVFEYFLVSVRFTKEFVLVFIFVINGFVIGVLIQNTRKSQRYKLEDEKSDSED